jgi:phospholipid transport system substrate-binding protein
LLHHDENGFEFWRRVMKTAIKRIGRLMVFALACLNLPALARAGEPLELLKVAANKAILVLKDPTLKSNEKKKERIEKLKAIANPIFDFEEMAKRTLGPHWRRRTPAEQQEFVKLFRDFLERVYADRIDLYSGEKVMFGRETVENDFAQVESTLVNPKGEEVSVVYRLRRSDGKWKIYDAVVENISVVNNYRSQFDRVISKSSFDELKKILREKSG